MMSRITNRLTASIQRLLGHLLIENFKQPYLLRRTMENKIATSALQKYINTI